MHILIHHRFNFINTILLNYGLPMIDILSMLMVIYLLIITQYQQQLLVLQALLLMPQFNYHFNCPMKI